MQCNPNQNAGTGSPVQQLLREIAKQLGLHSKKVANQIISIQKIVVQTLLLSTPSSSVDIEALEIEAETAMKDSAAIMVTYKADLHKLPVPVLVNILMGACGSVCAVAELQDLATALVAKEARRYESYDTVCEEGKKVGWVKYRDQLVAKYGVEKLQESFVL